MFGCILDFIKDAPTVLEATISDLFVDEGMTFGDIISSIKIHTDDLTRRITILVLK